jgi:ABC-type nitrate/sulfonate/bicarbonate transport system ATPase subunit
VGTVAVRVTGATKRYRHGRHAVSVLDGLDLDIVAGELLVVAGTSGSGKSTLLRVLAGLEPLDAGAVEWSGGWPAPTGMVFQQPLLMPWLTVRDNVRIGGRFRANRGRFDQGAADALLARFGLADLADTYPDALSGGQAQRVAVARAAAIQSRFLLLDEPFSALDPATRHDAQRWLRDTVTVLDLTAVLVTHDVDEALYLGDRIALLDGFGTVAHHWANPVTGDRTELADHPLRAELLGRYRGGVVLAAGESR